MSAHARRKLAEGTGFEPADGLPHLLISSQMPLTTQPPFHSSEIKNLRTLRTVPLFCYIPDLDPAFFDCEAKNRTPNRVPRNNGRNIYPKTAIGVRFTKCRSCSNKSAAEHIMAESKWTARPFAKVSRPAFGQAPNCA